MFVYLFVWETLSIPEETRDTRGRPAGAPETPQQDKRDQRKKPQVPAKEFDANKLLVLKAILELVSTLLKLIRELIEWLDSYILT